MKDSKSAGELFNEVYKSDQKIIMDRFNNTINNWENKHGKLIDVDMASGEDKTTEDGPLGGDGLPLELTGFTRVYPKNNLTTVKAIPDNPRQAIEDSINNANS